MSQTYRELLAWDYRSRINRPTQPGCKGFCRLEKHVKQNQLWKLHVDDELILYCRQCEYYTSKTNKFCYCCRKPMAFAEARYKKSRRTIINEYRVRY